MSTARPWIHQLARLCLLAYAVLLTPSCAEERASIDRVQPDYLDKNDLIPAQYAALSGGATPATLSPAVISREPVFFTQTTLIGKPPTTGFVGVTSYNNMEKIRWEVTERLLVARQSYDFLRSVPGGAGGIGQNPHTGEIVAAFAISSHFDIRNEYNPSTGEALNVREENTTDRPWYQRRYMHVDWSRNLIGTYNSVLEYERWEGRIRAEPVPVFVNTPDDPNAPVFEYQQHAGRRELRYFDIVQRSIVHPEEVDLGPDLPNLPVCFLGDGETACNPAELTFRVSFLRADPQRDYEPASLTPPIDGQTDAPPALDMERFGFFDTMRVGFDPSRQAVLDTQRIHFAARHNLWLHHHAPVVGANTSVGCNSDHDCAEGSVCHIGNTPRDATHRGSCAPLGIGHFQGDPACRSDDDCRSGANAMSASAVCDATTRTCGERYVRCATDADCTSVDAQSTCDRVIAATRPDNRGMCLLPFRQRQVRPIAYHETPNYPERMQPVTDAVVREWNGAFSEAVQAARRHECEIERSIDPSVMTAAANPCNAPSVIGTDPALGADGLHVMIGCHSPVWGTDASKPGVHSSAEVDAAHAQGWDLPACGAQGTTARLGDLRYHQIGAINDYDGQGYWGLANIAADPQTGEMVSGRGAVWQTITDSYAANLTDLVRLLNGDVLPTAVANGRTIVDGTRQLGSGATPSREVFDAPLRSPGALANLSRATAPALDAMRLPGAGWLTPESGRHLRSNDPENPGALTLATQRLLQGRTIGDGSNRALSRLNALRGTDLESMMVNGAQARLAPTATPDPTVALPATLEAASPLRGQSPARRRAVARIQRTLQAYQCNHEAAFDDAVLAGLADRILTGEPIRQSDPLDRDVAFGRDWTFRNPDGTVNYDTVRLYATQFIHHGVLAHEIGHSLGQRHNFTASADAVNYHDQYWALRGRGHARGVRPRWEYVADSADGHYYSAEEQAGRIEEFSYSSVMDYKGLNEDAHGVGRYDVAFIKNGYVGLVEAFRRVADRDAALTYSANVAGNGFSTPLDLRQWGSGGPVHGMHYSQIPAIFGRRPDGAPDLQSDNRYDVFLRETASVNVPGFGAPSFTNTTRDGHILVPYRFDTDERAGLVWQDQRNDAGADAYESLHYVASHWIDYYFINSYSRLRSGFNIESYTARMFGRFVEQLRQCAQTLAFDLIQFQDFLGTNPNWLRYRDDPSELGGFVNQAAMSVAADAFVNMTLMPEMGLHHAITRPDGVSIVTQNLDTLSGFPVLINQGRAFESDWRNDAGYWWYEQLNRAGSYYDKVMALDAFSDPELMLLQRDTPADLRLFQLSFYTMYPAQTLRLYGGILSEDTADFAPVVGLGDHAIARTHLATLNLPPGEGAGRSGRVLDTNHLPLDPQAHFTVQLRSAIMGIAQFPATFDQRFMDYARLWTDGSVEAITVSDAARDTVSFTDPWSHTTYRALHFGTAAGESGSDVGASSLVHASTGTTAQEAGVAARMLLHLADYETLRQRAISAGQTARASTIELEERKYLDLVHVMRRLTSVFGAGHITTH